MTSNNNPHSSTIYLPFLLDLIVRSAQLNEAVHTGMKEREREREPVSMMKTTTIGTIPIILAVVILLTIAQFVLFDNTIKVYGISIQFFVGVGGGGVVGGSTNSTASVLGGVGESGLGNRAWPREGRGGTC